MPAEGGKQRGPYKRWKFDGSNMPRSTRHSRLVLANSAGAVDRKKPVKRLKDKKSVHTAKMKLPVECHKTSSSAQKENIPCSTERTPELDHIDLFDLPQTSQTPACPHISVSRDNLQFCPLEELEELEQLEDFPFDPMGAAEERIEDSASGNEHVVDCWHVVSDTGADTSLENDDEDNFVLHLSLDSDTDQAAEISENVHNDPDSEDSDDGDEILDTAPGLHLNVNEKIKLLLLLATKKRHKLTYTAAEDILELAGVFSAEDPFVASRHIMKSAIEKYSFQLKEHHMCPACGKYIGVVTVGTFHCNDCNVVTDTAENKKNGTVFLYLSIKDQLKALLESLPADVLIDPMTREKISSYNYEDIFDGALYKLLKSVDTITLNFFIDGVPICTTSKQSAWPILITVNELPLMLRRKHVFMASLWLSKKKPVCNEYLKPFVMELLELAETGVSFRRNGTAVTLKVKACCCISDTIARPMIRNSKQFNGKFGCGFCYHPGIKMRMGRGETRSYTTSERSYPLRTHAGVMRLATLAEHHRKAQRGIKGKSILSQLPDFDVVRCIDLDSFHAVVNVAKRFCDLWFKPPPKGSRVPSYKIHNKMNLVNERLLRIKPTEEVSRTPRPLTERSDYRGHEWFYFVVFYSVPVLKNVLPSKFLCHWSLFVKGLAIFMQNSIAKSETVYADRYLQQFVADIDNLYGAQNVTFCCHLLTHLKRSVDDFAQPFTHSGYLYESFNNEVKEAVMSSNGAAKQIVKAMQLKVAVVKLEEELASHMSEEQLAYLDKINLRGKRLAPPHLILDSVSLHGKPKSAVISRDMKLAISRVGGICFDNTEGDFYDRFKINGEIFHATSYSRVSKRNNCVVHLESDQVFVIDSVVVISSDCFILGFYFQEKKNYKIVDEILPHIRILKDSPEGILRCIRPTDIISKLINFTVDISPEEKLNLACINVLLTEMLS